MTTSLFNVLSRWVPVVGYAAVLYYLSDQPKLPAPPGGDKTAHVVAYAGFAFLWARAWGPTFSDPRRFVWAWLAASLYGLFDEWHQSWVPGRTASAADFVADAIGGVLGAAAFIGVRLVVDRIYPKDGTSNRGVPYSSTEAAPRPSKEAS